MNIPRNNAVYSWTPETKQWVLRQRFISIRDAAAYYGGGNRAVVIDLLSGRMVVSQGMFCNRKRPDGIKNLPPIEKV